MKKGESVLDTWYMLQKGKKKINISDPAFTYSERIFDCDENGHVTNVRPNPLTLNQHVWTILFMAIDDLYEQ